jgi:signal peptidase
MEKAFQFISSIFWIFYVAFVLVSFATTASNSKSSPLPLRSFIVQSGSMEPTIMTGDVIFIKPQNAYQKDDIVTFHDAANRTVTHRILSDDEGKLTTKGDNNQATDPDPITQQNIVGKYQFRIPKAGYLLVHSQQPFGMFLLIAIPLILIVGSEIFKEKPKKHDNTQS